MLSKNLLKSRMTLFGDSQKVLAKAMGLSLSRLNAKINERNGAALNLLEMSFIVRRYNLSNDEACDLFFAH